MSKSNRKDGSPFFYAQKGSWYVWHDDRRQSLGVKGKGNRKEAVRAWYRLMVEEPKPETEPETEPTVKAVVDAFLADKQGLVKPNTYATYKGLLTGFGEGYATIKAEAFTAAMAYAYANRPKWSGSHRHNLLGSIATAFKWAEGVGMIPVDPVKGIKRPPKASRGSKVVLSDADHLKLLEAANPALRLLLTLLHATGCRPSELARLTASDVDFANGVAMLAEHKTDASGKPRIIILSPSAIALLRTQAALHPVGTLLRNARGGKWSKDGIGLAMRRVSKVAGVKAIAYGYRHSFATAALANGVPDATVAALLGHSSTAMLHRHYSHLTSQATVLRETLSKVRG